MLVSAHLNGLIYKCKSNKGEFGVMTKMSLSVRTGTKSRIGSLSRSHIQLLTLIGYFPVITSPMTPVQLPDMLKGPKNTIDSNFHKFEHSYDLVSAPSV